MTGRLSTFAAALVVARRDFSAILFSRSFSFFLLGPLFPVVVAALAGGVGQKVPESTARPPRGIVMQAEDAAAMSRGHEALATEAANRRARRASGWASGELKGASVGSAGFSALRGAFEAGTSANSSALSGISPWPRVRTR